MARPLHVHFSEKGPQGRREGLKAHEAIRLAEGLAMMKTLFIIGLAICGIAATLLLMGKIESGVAAIVGIIGISILSSSGMKWRHAPLPEERP